MPASITAPEDIVNISLGRIGYKGRIGSFYDGTTAAVKAMDIYAQTRDELLRKDDWTFSRRDIEAVLLKQGPVNGDYVGNPWNPITNPPVPWMFEYQYPSDCLKVRTLKPQPLFGPNFNPQPNLFSIANDNNYTPPKRVILSNVENAILTYTGQVTDPSTWPPDFVELVADAIGRRLAPVLANLDAAKMEAEAEQRQTAAAEAQQG